MGPLINLEVIKPYATIFQILLQLGFVTTCVLAYKKQTNGQKYWWAWLAQGASWQVIRRILYFVMLGIEPSSSLKFITFIIVPTCVSISYFIGGLGAIKYMAGRQKTVQDLRKTITVIERNYRRSK